MDHYTQDHKNYLALEGATIKSMMRQARVTIRQYSEANDIPMARVRVLREKGVPGGLRSWEIHIHIQKTKHYFH